MSELSEYEIKVSAQSSYVDEQSIPGQDRYVFAYIITISNTGTLAATLLRRHWLITDANNKQQEVHGDGVIGEQPRISPGESYRYTSGAMLETPVGYMEGRYDMVADDGTEFTADIPAFTLKTPGSLH